MADEVVTDEIADMASIGAYVCAFSALVVGMRIWMVQQLAAKPPILAEIPFGDASARHIADAFFGMCHAASPLVDKADRKVPNWIADRVQKEITWRNDVAHGDLWPRHPEGTQMVRVDPTSRDGFVQRTPVTPTAIKGHVDAIIMLSNLVNEIAAVSFHHWPYDTDPTVRVPDILVMRNRQVVRAGDRASEFTSIYSVPQAPEPN